MNPRGTSEITETHTVDEALERFTLIRGAGDGEKTACAMTTLSWVAGEAWTDTPPCAHRLLAAWAIRANDHADTTATERADIVRAGATGIIDTWWVPAEVLLWAWVEAPKDAKPAGRVVAVADAVSKWKASAFHERPDLRDANLGGAYLRGADLRGAYLGGADLRDADLGGAYLRGADLRDANLGGAYLRGADLRDANLGGAYLRGADLRGADLRGADLRDADLGGADLRDADLGGAYLRGADLRGAYSTPSTVWPARR